MPRMHAFGDDALGDHDVIGLAEAIRTGRVGTAEAVEAAIARTESVNPALNGLAYNAFEQARRISVTWASSRRLRRRPDLHQGQRRRRRSSPRCMAPTRGRLLDGRRRRRVHPVVSGHRAGIAGQDADCRSSGSSAAAEHPRLGPVRNPWNTDCTAGASSSGSGAFVAAGVVPIAHANDGGGSIRIPAACNGLVGVKPSRGRLPLDPEVRSANRWGIVANGVLTRSVRDTAAFYREAERIWRNPKLAPIGDVTRPGRRRVQDRGA